MLVVLSIVVNMKQRHGSESLSGVPRKGINSPILMTALGGEVMPYRLPFWLDSSKKDIIVSLPGYACDRVSEGRAEKTLMQMCISERFCECL